MTSQTCRMAGPRGDRTRGGPRPAGSTTGRVRLSRLKLFEVGVGGDAHHSHVNAGHQTMSNSDTRASVIIGVCRQDPKAWREFDAIYRPMLLAFLRHQGLQESDAHDVVQDIFVKLLGKINTYDREKYKFRTWLFSVAHHALIDLARRRASYRKAVDGWVVNILRATDSDSLKMAEDWVRIHRTKILAHALKTVRARSSTRAWACFEQRILRDRPGAEIALELGVDPNVVFVNASRVMKQVREVCQEFDEDLIDALDSTSLSRRG